MDVIERVADSIRLYPLFSLEQPILVAVSGGADSLCLMDALHRLGYRLQVAHFDHGWRDESGDDLRFVEHLAADYGLPFVGERAQPAAPDSQQGESLEAISRRARYRFLLRVAIERRIPWVATGHTATDQAETVLMNLIRGSGARGLSGMRPETSLSEWDAHGKGADVRLGRPLLTIGRDETAAYCRVHGLSPRHDPTNKDTAHLRNRIRLEILPTLRAINPSIESALCRTAEVMAAVTDLVEQEGVEAWEAAVRAEGPSAVTLDEGVLEGQPLALQREVMRRALQELDVPLREGGFDTVEALLGRSKGESPDAWNLPGGLRHRRSQGQITLYDPAAIDLAAECPQLVDGTAVVISGAGVYELASGWRLRVDRMKPDDLDSAPPSWQASAWIEVFDAVGGFEGMALRRPQRGDRLDPFGMEGTSKVSDLFTDAKVPRPARRRWPILVEGDELLWVPGVRRGKGRPIMPETAEIIRFELACEESHNQ